MSSEFTRSDMNIIRYWRVIWQKKFVLILVTVVSMSTSLAISLYLPKYYKSDTVIMVVGSESGTLGSSVLSAMPFAGMLPGGTGIQSPSDKIMVILKSRSTAESVIKRLNLLQAFNPDKWDAEKGSWKRPSNPPLMSDAISKLSNEVVKFSKTKEGAVTISVEWQNPKLTSDIANYYVNVLTEFLNEKSINTTIQIVDRAVPAERKSKPRIRENVLIAGVLSGLAAILIIFLENYMKDQNINH